MYHVGCRLPHTFLIQYKNSFWKCAFRGEPHGLGRKVIAALIVCQTTLMIIIIIYNNWILGSLLLTTKTFIWKRTNQTNNFVCRATHRA